jgi:hypothetical protein
MAIFSLPVQRSDGRMPHGDLRVEQVHPREQATLGVSRAQARKVSDASDML